MRCCWLEHTLMFLKPFFQYPSLYMLILILLTSGHNLPFLWRVKQGQYQVLQPSQHHPAFGVHAHFVGELDFPLLSSYFEYVPRILSPCFLCPWCWKLFSTLTFPTLPLHSSAIHLYSPVLVSTFCRTSFWYSSQWRAPESAIMISS